MRQRLAQIDRCNYSVLVAARGVFFYHAVGRQPLHVCALSKAGAVRGQGSMDTRQEIVSQFRQRNMRGARRQQPFRSGRGAH
jgi:hypothetical protein